MESTEFTFDQQAFQEWLKHDTSKPFQIVKDSGIYSRGTRLTKVNSHEDYSLLFSFDPYYLGELKNLQCSNYSGNLELRAVYFNKINTLVYENSYYKKDLENLCDNIRITNFHDIYEEIFEKINKELNNNIPSLKECFKNELELIAEKKKNNQDNIFQHLTGYKEDSISEFINDYKFKEIKNRQMAYDFLLNPTNFINTFVNDYLKDEQNLNIIKHVTCFNIAVEELKEEIKDSIQYKKGLFIIGLLRKELRDKNKIWLVKKDGDKVQVENRFRYFELNNIEIGEYSNATKLDDIAMIKFNRAEYLIPNFY